MKLRHHGPSYGGLFCYEPTLLIWLQGIGLSHGMYDRGFRILLLGRSFQRNKDQIRRMHAFEGTTSSVTQMERHGTCAVTTF